MLPVLEPTRDLAGDLGRFAADIDGDRVLVRRGFLSVANWLSSRATGDDHWPGEALRGGRGSICTVAVIPAARTTPSGT